MKGVTHGACDYLLKPVRIEELRNIWQHVVRKKTKEMQRDSGESPVEQEDNKELVRTNGAGGSGKRSGGDQGGGEDGGSDSDAVGGKRKKEQNQLVEHQAKLPAQQQAEEEEESGTLKKARVVWSIELHQQFVNAVNKLGVDSKSCRRALARIPPVYVCSLTRASLTRSFLVGRNASCLLMISRALCTVSFLALLFSSSLDVSLFLHLRLYVYSSVLPSHLVLPSPTLPHRFRPSLLSSSSPTLHFPIPLLPPCRSCP